MEDRVITQLLRRVYCDKSGKWDDPMAFDFVRFYKEGGGTYRLKLIRSVLDGDQLGKLNVKILHCICILLGLDESAQIMARFFHFASNDKEMGRFVSFALTVVPHLSQSQSPSATGVMTLAVSIAVMDSRKIEAELGEFVGAANRVEEEGGPSTTGQGRNPLERHLVRNLLTLVKWQEQSEQMAALRHIGLNLADIRGDFQEGLLNWALDYTELVRRRPAGGGGGGGTLDQTSSEVLNTFYSLMVAVTPQVQLPLSSQNKLLTKISAFIVSMLKFIKKEKLGTPFDGVDVFAQACALSGRIFSTQMGADQAQLLRALMDEVFGSYFELFGGDIVAAAGNVQMKKNREVGASASYAKFRRLDFVNVERKGEHSVFNELRQMSLEERSAAAVAHSGTLARKRPAPAKVQQGGGQEGDEEGLLEPAQIRRLLFVDFVEFLCTGAKPKVAGSQPMPSDWSNLRMCRFLGQLLIDRFAGDGLASHLSWFCWPQERELIANYIEVTKLMDQFPVVLDFLLLLADVGFQGLCFVLPLVKALFVATLGQLENTSLKKERVSPSNSRKCDQILALLISADFYPEILSTFHKLLANSTNHEAFVLMRDLWDYLRSTIPPADQIRHHSKIVFGPAELRKREGSQLVSSMVLLIQRDMASRSALLPELLAQTEERDENDWAMEREPRPIAVMAEIRR